MKKVLSMILLAGFCVGPVTAGEVGYETVASMAQEGSGVPIDQLCMAVYNTVKAMPDKAVDIFQTVITQRNSWTATEVYAILRAVLLAAPGVDAEFVRGVETYQASGYKTFPSDTEGAKLLSTLYTLPHTNPVATAVVQGVIGNAAAKPSTGNGVFQGRYEAYIPVFPVTPTPPPTSFNN